MAWRGIASPLLRSVLSRSSPISSSLSTPYSSSLSSLSSPSFSSSFSRRWISEDAQKDKEALDRKLEELKQQMKDQKIQSENLQKDIENFGKAEHVSKAPYKAKSAIETVQGLFKEDDFLTFWCFYFTIIIFYVHSCRISMKGEQEEEEQKKIVEKQKQLFHLSLLKNNYPAILTECLEQNLRDFEKDVKGESDVTQTLKHYTKRIIRQTEKKMSTIFEQENSNFLLDYFSASPAEVLSASHPTDSSPPSDFPPSSPPPPPSSGGQESIRF